MALSISYTTWHDCIKFSYTNKWYILQRGGKEIKLLVIDLDFLNYGLDEVVIDTNFMKIKLQL